jgi:tetratricopeptide (TPR) repeat protein
VPVTIPGDYKETYKKGINAKNLKRWDEAVGFFQTARQQKATDTGERINISGFGNNEPYVPKYYLGLAFKNLGKCDEALRAWEASERDGAIQKIGGLYKSLAQNRAECQQRGR